MINRWLDKTKYPDKVGKEIQILSRYKLYRI